MPESVTIALSIDTPDRKTGENKRDCSAKINIKLHLSHPAQGRRAAQGSPSSILTLSPEPGTPLVTATKGRAISSLNSHPTTAKPAPVPTKRTKKIAKPKSKGKGKTFSPSRGPPTKKRKGEAKRPKSASKQAKIQPAKKLEPDSKPGGRSTKDAQQETSGQKYIHPQTKTKRKNANAQSSRSSPHIEQPKKRTKKANPANKKHQNVSPAKQQGMEDTNNWLGRGGSQQSGGDNSTQHLSGESLQSETFLLNTTTEDSKTEKVVSGLVDMVADEIHYCASVFGPGPSNTVDDLGRNLPLNKLRSVNEVAAEARYLPSFLPQELEFKSNTTYTSSFGSTHAEKVSLVASRSSYSDRVSTDRYIHPMKSNACSPEKGYKNSTDSVNSVKSQLQEQGRPSNLKMRDVQTVVIAIRRFVLEVYYPFLLSAKQNARNGSPSADRIRISTLLAIREVLIMNAEKLFTFSYLNQSPTDSVERDVTYLSHVFANAVVRNTAKRLHMCYPESCFFEDFVQATRNYDAKSEDFQTSLARADVRSVYAHSDGTKVGQQESVLAKVSFNYARTRHPLLSNNKSDDQLGQVEMLSSRTHQGPTACTVFQIEADAARDETEDDANTLESLKNMLRFKYK